MTNILHINERGLHTGKLYSISIIITCYGLYSPAFATMYKMNEGRPASAVAQCGCRLSGSPEAGNQPSFKDYAVQTGTDTIKKKRKGAYYTTGKLPLLKNSVCPETSLQLNFFRAVYHDSGRVELIWEVDNAMPDSLCFIEKSADGNIFIPSAIVRPEPGRQHFIDKPGKATGGLWYYRIKTLTREQCTRVSDFIPVKDNSREYKVSVLFAGIQNSRTIIVSAPVIRIEVMNTTGQVVLREEQPVDVQLIQIPELPAGAYSLSICDRNDHILQFFFRQ